MSTAAKTIRAKQWIVAGAILAGVLAIAGIGSLMITPPTDTGPVAPPPKLTTLQPGVGSKNAEEWRVNAATDIERMRKQLEQLTQDQERDRRERELRAQEQAKRELEGKNLAPPEPPAGMPAPGPFRTGGTLPNTPEPPLPPGAERPAKSPIATIELEPTSTGGGGADKGLLVQGTQALGESMVGKPATPATAAASAPTTTQTYIPAGSYMKALLLNGMDAPTGGQAQSNPAPALLKIIDNGKLPNFFRTQLKDCVVTANGYGELSSERALIRTDRLSCVTPAGGAVDIAIRGYIAGEDGKAGLRGKVISKTGEALGNAIWAAGLSALGAGISGAATSNTQTQLGTTVTSVDNPATKAFGDGTKAAFDRLAQYYINLADKLFPVVEIDGGRVVEIVITNGFTLTIATN